MNSVEYHFAKQAARVAALKALKERADSGDAEASATLTAWDEMVLSSRQEVASSGQAFKHPRFPLSTELSEDPPTI